MKESLPNETNTAHFRTMVAYEYSMEVSRSVNDVGIQQICGRIGDKLYCAEVDVQHVIPVKSADMLARIEWRVYAQLFFFITDSNF